MTNPADPVMDLTETLCAYCDQESAENEEMIGCDGCQRFFHIRCVEATADVKKDEKWYCDEDACQIRGQELISKKKKNRGKKNGDDSDRSSVKSDRALTLEHKMKAMEEKRKRMEYELEMEMKLKKKEMEFKRAIEIKRILLEKQLQEEEDEEEKRLQEKILQQRKEQLIRMKARQQSFTDEMKAMDEAVAKLQKSTMKRETKKHVDAGEGTSGVDKKSPKIGKPTKQNLQMLKAAQDEDSDEDGDITGDDDSAESEDDQTDFSEESDRGSEGTGGTKDCKPKKKVDKRSQDGLGQKRSGPTKMQLAARSGLSKKLPNFSRKPEEWPLFYGMYQASNVACGYSDVENLVRLQDCLKGPALEMVRGQLLLPRSVPKVVQKLRQLYGRPEQLLQSHLEKIRRLEPPKAGKLASFIPFGTAVEQLCEHLEAADLKQHLINPLLIQELVDKFPDGDKREWVRYKRGKRRVTLRTLTDFLSEIVSDACEANVSVEYKPTGHWGKAIQRNERGSAYDHSEDDDHQSGFGERRNLKPCRVCQGTDHWLRNCLDFKNLSYADRMEVVDRWNVCHVCLNEHGSAQCKFKLRCNVGDCRQAHNSVLHPTDGVIGTSAHIWTNNTVMFRMVPVKLHCGEKSITALAFLDEGASVTLVEKNLADRLGVVGVHEKLTIKWTADITREENDSTRMNMWVSGVEADEKLLLKTVRTVDKLMLPTQSLDAKELSLQYNHMQGLPIPSYHGRPELLIGLNNINSFAPIEAKIGGVVDPIAVRCKLGWTVYGPKQGNVGEAGGGYLGVHQKVTDEGPSKLLETHYALEESAVNVPPETADDKGIRRMLEKTTKRIVDHVEVGLLWKTDDIEFPECNPMSLRKPKQLKRKLEMNSVLSRNVYKKIDENQNVHQATSEELVRTKQTVQTQRCTKDRSKPLGQITTCKQKDTATGSAEGIQAAKIIKDIKTESEDVVSASVLYSDDGIIKIENKSQVTLPAAYSISAGIRQFRKLPRQLRLRCYNPMTISHTGGILERMKRSVKDEHGGRVKQRTMRTTIGVSVSCGKLGGVEEDVNPELPEELPDVTGWGMLHRRAA